MTPHSFEWDEGKNLANLKEHGVSFGEAQFAFLDPRRIIAHDEKRRYPRAHAAWHLKFKFELNLPFVHPFLMLHVPPDDGLIQPNGRRKKPRRP